LPLAQGVELVVDQRHPLLRSNPDERAIVDTFRSALASLLPAGNSTEER
jgi:hypothetical protein